MHLFVQVTAGAKGTTLKQLQEGLKYPAPDHIKKGYSTLIPTLHSTELIKIESANAVFLQANNSHRGTILWKWSRAGHRYFLKRDSVEALSLNVNELTF